MIRERWQQSNLFVRLAWGVALVFVLLHLLYSARHAKEQFLSNAELFAVTSVDRARTMAEVAGTDSELLQRLSTPTFKVEAVQVKPEPPLEDVHYSAQVEAAAQKLQGSDGGNLALESIWVEDFVPAEGARRHRESRLVIVLPHEGGWLKVTTDMRSADWRNPSAGAVGTIVMALLLFAAVLLGMRRVTRFLPKLADAAEALGRGQTSEPLQLQGPAEVRRVAVAFNEMQRRVTDHVSERTTMLAAFSHDLRTLATRLHLRLENQPESEERRRSTADLDSMTRILDEAVAFARDDVDQEGFRSVDLKSLLQTLLDDAADGARLAGAKVVTELHCDEAVTLQAQPLALTRALANLIDNALKYGGAARVSVRPAELVQTAVAGVQIDIADDGPGIPEADRTRVLQPYVRLEQSRNRSTGGVGLGLAIVNSVVRRHGGRIVFLHEGDFTVRLELPKRHFDD
ncbi:MAG: ATP-binding protein [Pseudomonadales bacterium]